MTKLIINLLFIIPGFLLVPLYGYADPHYRKSFFVNQESFLIRGKANRTENTTKLGLAIIKDIKKGCQLLSSRKINEVKILRDFGMPRSKDNLYLYEVKPFNDSLERVAIVKETLQFDFKNPGSILIEDLEAAFGVFVILGPDISRHVELEFKYKVLSTDGLSSKIYDIRVGYSGLKVSRISVSQSLFSNSNLNEVNFQGIE
jgi:hypothetical protein